MLPSHHHAVQFYGNESQLFTTVSGFLSEGLISGHPALVVATRAHREGILDAMRGRFVDVSRAQHAGDLTLLDAQEVLSSLMTGPNGRPDRERFEVLVGLAIDRASQGRALVTVRAYGEMVDVLWKEGQTDAALALEALWNDISRRRRLALLCGYSVGNFTTQVEQFQSICEHHTHVIGPDAELTTPYRRADVR